MIQIRAMQQEDILDVQHIATASWHATYEGIIPRPIQDRFLQMAYSESMLEKRLTQSPFYIAQLNNQLVGFANFSNKNGAGEVELAAIYLLPNVQAQGIGSQLLAHAIKQLQPEQLVVNVESDNKIGQRFYEAKGFEVLAQFEDDFDGYVLQTTRLVKRFKNTLN